MRLTTFGALATALAIGTAAQASNLVTNGSFTANSLGSVAAAGYAGAEIDTHWSYPGGVTGWSSPAGGGYDNAYNLYFFGAPSSNPDADTRYTASEAQHPNANFTGNSPDGGAFMVLDGDPSFTGPLEQTVGGLVIGKTYELTFWWAAGELSNRTGYETEQLTGMFGTDAFATSVYTNTNPVGVPGSFSGWSLQSFTFTAGATSQLLQFLSVGTPSANLPPVAFLDGVSLSMVPEPAVWGLMVVGFGGLGVALRRRRRLAAA